MAKRDVVDQFAELISEKYAPAEDASGDTELKTTDELIKPFVEFSGTVPEKAAVVERLREMHFQYRWVGDQVNWLLKKL